MDTEHEPFDFIIIGQGLAGSTLAWQLHWRGQRCMIIDRNEPATSSKIAGGLITPVTGQRLVPTWRLDEFWPAATEFYQRIESETGRQFLHHPGQVRLFQNEAERDRFDQRDPSQISTPLTQPDKLVDAGSFHSLFGGFEMPTAARLDIPSFLDATRTYFAKVGLILESDVDIAADLRLAESNVELPRFNIRARRLVFCEGFAATGNPWLSALKFDATRGELLTVRVPGLTETRIVGCGVWLAPLGNDLFRVGSTYDWQKLDSAPTDAGRKELCERLARFLRLPFEVVDHQAAVRPILVGRHPVLGLIPNEPRLAVFNGLGSKGSLQAPLLGQQLTELLLDQRPADESVDIQHRLTATSSTSLPTTSLRLTEQAHAAIERVLQSGDIAIDATAGNGHDTCFLARTVGPSGHVFAFDIQSAAIEHTCQRLKAGDLHNVELFHESHANMTTRVPNEMHSEVAAAMFNLGFLPRSDKSIITTPDQTLPALQSAFNLIRPGGVVTVLVYAAHAGGESEAAAVEGFLNTLDADEFSIETLRSASSNPTSPRLHIITRLG